MPASPAPAPRTRPPRLALAAVSAGLIFAWLGCTGPNGPSSGGGGSGGGGGGGGGPKFGVLFVNTLGLGSINARVDGPGFSRSYTFQAGQFSKNLPGNPGDTVTFDVWRSGYQHGHTSCVVGDSMVVGVTPYYGQVTFAASGATASDSLYGSCDSTWQ